MPRNNKDWSVEEEGRLITGLAAGKSMAVIAKELGRTEAAVSSRASTIRHRDEKLNGKKP